MALPRAHSPFRMRSSGLLRGGCTAGATRPIPRQPQRRSQWGRTGTTGWWQFGGLWGILLPMAGGSLPFGVPSWGCEGEGTVPAPGALCLAQGRGPMDRPRLPSQ